MPKMRKCVGAVARIDIQVARLVKRKRAGEVAKTLISTVPYLRKSLTAIGTDDADIASLFGMTNVPGWVVLDEFNRVIHRETGPIGVDGFAALVNAAAEQVGG